MKRKFRKSNLALLFLFFAPIHSYAIESSTASLIVSAGEAEIVGDYPKALRQYSSALKSEQTRDQAIVPYIRLLVRTRRETDALEILRDYLDETNPFHVDARMELAKLHITRGESEDALKQLRALQNLRRGYIPAHRMEVELLLEFNRGGEAIERASAFLAKHESNEILILRAKAYVMQGAAAHAVKDANLALKSFPQNFDAHEVLGDAYLLEGDHVKAEQCWLMAERVSPGNPAILEKLADLYVQVKRNANAQRLYTRILKSDPARLDILVKRGKLHLSMGQSETASEEFKKVLTTDPSHEGAQYQLVKSYLKQGMNDEAGRLLHAWKNRYPERDWINSAHQRLIEMLSKTPSSSNASRDLSSSFAEDVITVKTGETLMTIAKRLFNSYQKWHAIYSWNRDVISNPDRVEPGTRLKIKKMESQ